MLTVTTAIAEGGGQLPKNIDLNSILFLDASSNSGNTFDWEILSHPANSTVRFFSPTTFSTKVGPLDKHGVYLIRGWLNKEEGIGQASTLLAFHVPATVSPLPLPSAPSYETGGGGGVRNWSFELPGSFTGWALYWTTIDTDNLLNHFAGVTRGRCVPTNFTPEYGNYAMVLGDDIPNGVVFASNEYIEVSQSVDLTKAEFLRVALKFTKR